MAVTSTIDELVNDVRVVDVPTERAKLQRLMNFYAVAVVWLAPDADDEAHNMALRQAVGYAFDAPAAPAGARFANVLRFSGAASTLLPWRQHGGGGDGAASAPASAGGNAVVGLSIVAGNIVLLFGDGSTQDVALPPSIGGLSVTNVMRNGDNLDITYSDGSVVSIPIPASGGNLQWPGL